MPGGSNCAIPGCHTQRSKCRGLSFHRLPKKGKNEIWRAALVKAIDRADRSFNPDKASICSRHFKDACFKIGATGMRLLISGSLPTEWMPVKSIVTPKPQPRKEPMRRPEPPVADLVAYYTFAEVRMDVDQRLPSAWCMLRNCDTCVSVGLIDSTSLNIKVKVDIFDDFSVKVFIFGMPVPNITDTVEKKKVAQYLENVAKFKICTGVTESELQSFASLPSNSVRQVYFRQVRSITSGEEGSVIRSVKCCLVIKPESFSSVCSECMYTKGLVLKKKQRHEVSCSRPLNKHDPLQAVSKQKIASALKECRRKEKSLQQQVEKFKTTFAEESVGVSPSLNDSLSQIVNDTTDPLAKLFWEEQRKAFAAKEHGMRWHPMLIRLAILIHSRSPLVYDTLRKTGVLKLPGSSTLRDYTNAFHPKEGFSRSALDELKRLSKNLKSEEKFVVLLHDEMAIKTDLVFDKRSGEIVGFINPDLWVEDVGSNLANHVLVFFVVGINSNINVSLGFFGTSTATAGELFPLFWQAVGYLEIDCQLKVIASTSDKASANQKMYQMHQQPDSRKEACYKAVNMFAPDRYVYFISDPPHLMKTVRNNMFNSGSGKKTNYLWCQGKHILWKHIVDLYYQDSATETRYTKLTYEHISLTGTSCMNVRLAAQVLSRSVGKMMEVFGNDDASETAKFILMMNRFFDCLNVRSTTEAERKRNDDLAPYRDIYDSRFDFLLHDFLGYIDQWKQSTIDRPGPFTPQERSRMFLTHQTSKGLAMTVHAFCEATRYLLENGVSQILSNIFCQDPLEEHFGRHRGLGRRCENPSVWAFSYQENKLRIQRSLALQIQPKGNVQNKREVRVDINTSPLKKTKRHK